MAVTRVRAPGLARWSIIGLALVVVAALQVPAARAVDGPSGSPSPASSAGVPTVYHDTFEEPGSWWIGSDDLATSHYSDGGLRWTLKAQGSMWDSVILPAASARVRVSAAVRVEEGSGGGGPTCGAGPGDDLYIWAGINGDGEWLLGRIVDSRLQVAMRGELPVIRKHDVPSGEPFSLVVTLECLVDPLGAGDRATVWIEDVQVADIVDAAVGPFDRAGLVAASDGPGFSILFDDFDAQVLAADGPVGSPGTSASPSAD